jgi:hypothetical protein
MPRGDPTVWRKNLGVSYAELSATQTSSEQTHTLTAPPTKQPIQAETLQTLRSQPAAGTPSRALPRGAGAFQAQSDWSLGASTSGTPDRSFATEAKSYGPPPAGYRAPPCGRRAPSQMPQGNHANDWRWAELLPTSCPGARPGPRTQPCSAAPVPPLHTPREAARAQSPHRLTAATQAPPPTP